MNIHDVSTLQDDLRIGGTRIARQNLQNTGHPRKLKIGRCLKEWSKRPSMYSLMTKFKKLYQKIEDPEIL